jgi:hypothetical protein
VLTTSDLEARLGQASSLPEIMDVSFGAFEAIRIAARDCQDRVPELFAAFMMTADAAVDGREALTPAPSLPLTSGAEPANAGEARADASQVADALAALAAVLRDRLTLAAARAVTLDDRTACQDAAEAARQICQLMTR